MANLLDTSYFIGNLKIPIDESGILAKLNQAIKIYEPEILQKVLGYDLYRSFLYGLLEDPILPKWTDLQNGKEYQIDGIYKNWRGLLNVNKDSLIAYYVWLKFVQSDGSYISGSGIVQSKSENSEVDLTYKSIAINYNRMIEMVKELNDFINANISDYLTFEQSNLTKFLFF